MDISKKTIIQKYTSDNSVYDFKVIKDTIIVQESVGRGITPSNIYCLDIDFKVLWISGLPFLDDSYPNEIIWDTRINEESELLETIYLPDLTTFTTASQKGISVTLDYATGKIKHKVFTK